MNTRLSGAQVRNNSIPIRLHVLPDTSCPSSGSAPYHSPSADECPVYCGRLSGDDVADFLKNGSIYDQPSLEKVWRRTVEQLKTQSVSDEEALEILESGILQTPTGKALAPLLVEALMLSIRPLTGLNPARSREFVEIICHLPPNRWADAFGENVNFPQGSDGKGVRGFIQTQLESSRLQRDQEIASGEPLDDATWTTLRDLTKLIQFEAFTHVRPSPKEAKELMAQFIQDIIEVSPREGWKADFSQTVQQIDDLLAGIEIVDNRPERSLLEEIIDPNKLKQTLAKIATPINIALNALGSLSREGTGSGLHGAMNEAVERTALGSGPESFNAQTELMLALQEIDRTSSFYEHVVTSGPVYTGGFWGKVLYVANALDTVGILSIAQKVKPHLTAVPTQAPANIDVTTPEPVNVDLSLDAIRDQVTRLETEVYDFLSSIERQAESGLERANAQDAAGSATIASPSQADEFTLERWTESVGKILKKIDSALTFPMASAEDSPETPFLQQLQGAREAFQGVHEAFIMEVEGEDTSPPSASPSTWEMLTPQLHTTLAQLSAVLATFGRYAVGSAATSAHWIKSNPKTAAAAVVIPTTVIGSAAALYDAYSPAETPESPTLHQERIDDSIENILSTPIDSHNSTLSDAILGLMYESDHHNLLDDSTLIQQVAELLDKPSEQVADQTYVELIEAVLAQTHSRHPAAHPKEVILASSPSVKRHIRSAGEAPEPQQEATGDTQQAPEADESAATPEALVTDYLKALEDPRTSNIDVDVEVDNETALEPKIDAAEHAILLLRRRRHILWTDASRADGDRQLAARYTVSLLRSVDPERQGSEPEVVVVPAHSTLGQCYLNFIKAVKNPFFTDWARQEGVDLSTVKVHHEDSSLVAMARGVRTRFVLTDSTWARVAGPVLTAAKVLDPLGKGIHYPDQNPSVPLGVVADFYDQTLPLNQVEAQRQANELIQRQGFCDIKAGDPHRPPELRSEEVLKSQRQRVGDVYTHHALITALNAYLERKTDNAAVNLDAVLLAVHPDASFSARYPTEARRGVTARRLINASGWTEPKTTAEIKNLVNALSVGFVEEPSGNYWGAADYPRPLTPAQKNTIISETARFLEHSGFTGLLDYLAHEQRITGASLETAMGLVLDSEKGKNFGKALEVKLNAISTPTSAAEWLMAALVLNLEPAAGSERNHVAGYNLTQTDNWGAKPSTVVERFERHILDSGKACATIAPYAARHLLSGIAPEFLVRDLPVNLVCGSHTWTMLRIAVARIEQLAPGSTSRMTFEQVMSYGDTSPISVGQAVAVEMVSVNPLIDWSIANGVITQTASDIYSAQQLNIAREKFQHVREELGRAQGYLSEPPPTRKSIALAELTRIYGKDVPFEKIALYNKNIPQSVRKKHYSMLDLYITGRLASGKYNSIDSQVNISSLEPKFHLLKNVSQLFESQFSVFFDNLRTGSHSIFRYLTSQLSLDDRKSLEYGEQQYYSLRSEIDVARTRQTREQIEAAKGRHGLLIRSEYKQKVTYFEVFPSAITIRTRTDLPVHLALGGRVAVKSNNVMFDPYKEVQRGTPLKVDWEAYKTGSVPREGITSNVIIEQIIPVTQQVTFYPSGYDFETVPNVFSSQSRVDHIASVAVDEHFVTGREELRELAKGSTASEQEEIFAGKVRDFFLGLIPFKSCIENGIKGDTAAAALDCTLDAAGFLLPGAAAISKGAQVLKSGAKVLPKVLKLSMITSTTLVSAANPFDGLLDGVNFAKNAVCKLSTRAYSAASKGVDKLKGLYGCTKAVDSADLLKHADIAEGVCDSVTAAGQTTKTTARFKDGNWYAYDVIGNRAYGPPLDNFKPDSAITLERTTFGDGSTAYTNSQLFSDNPHTIQRSTGTDVIVGDKVYRFDPNHPETLNDITSPAYFKEMEGFEAVCSSGRNKRETRTCFSKILDTTLDTGEKRRAQAFEHKRLYPTTGEQGVSPRVIFERRIFKCAADFLKCHPDQLTVSLQFKSATSGSIIPNDYFGFAGRINDPDFNAATRVVKINSIVQGMDDAREVRAVIVNVPGKLWGETRYLVAEADTGLFYYCRYDGQASGSVEFKNIPLSEEGLGAKLIGEYHKIKDPYIRAAGKKPDNDFVPLPPLNHLYKELEYLGWDTADIDNLKKLSEKLSDVQKRELILTAVKSQTPINIEVVIPAIKIEPITKPPFFDSAAPLEKNRVFANGAKQQVDAQLTATGLGPANQRVASDANDIQRQALTQPVVIWQYSRSNAPDAVDMLIKTGAGNCDHMAAAAIKIIQESGGTASAWRMPGAHTFTVVGVPQKGPVASTSDFSEEAFKNAWIVDPWAGVSCPAKDYKQAFQEKMNQWEVEGRSIIVTDWKASPPVARWMSPIDPVWMDMVNAPKQPSY